MQYHQESVEIEGNGSKLKFAKPDDILKALAREATDLQATKLSPPDFLLVSSGFIVQSKQIKTIIVDDELGGIVVTFIDGDIQQVEFNNCPDLYDYVSSLCAVLNGERKQFYA